MWLRCTTILAAIPVLVRSAMGAARYEVAGITVPEPASLALLGAAMLGFIKLLRKKLRS